MKARLFVLLLLPGISSANTPILGKINLKAISEQEQPIVKKTLDRIIGACPSFRKYWGDVKSTEVDVRKGIKGVDHRRDQFGWKNYVVLIIQVKDKTNFIPAKYKVSGHTLTYYAGGGDRPGILTQKRQAQYFFGGFEYADFSRDAFISDPAMTMLDGLK